MPRTIKNYPRMISLRIDSLTYEKLEKLRKEKKINRSNFIREIIKFTLNKLEELEKTKI